MNRFDQDYIVQQLKTLDAHVRLIFIHPNFLPQHVFLYRFLPESSAGVYVRFEGARLTHQQLSEQLQAAIQQQAEKMRLSSIKTVVLDEADRAESEALRSYLDELLSSLGKCRVVVISRIVPPWTQDTPALRHKAVFLPVHPDRMLWDYARRENQTALLEVRAFGRGQALLNGQTVEGWDGVLPRSLFFYLVDRGMTTRNDIFATFWPNLSIKDATNVFHVTKRKINEVLGMDLTVYWSGFYRISPDIELSYDVAHFSELVQDSAVAPDENARSLLEDAVDLYDGHFLTSLTARWVADRHAELKQMYGDALFALAKHYEKSGDRHRALGFYTRASFHCPQREDIAEGLTQLLYKSNALADALVAYERLELALGQSVGVPPAPKLQKLAERIRSELSGQSPLDAPVLGEPL
jgi:DNA-binding SARP family transcriptional activator